MDVLVVAVATIVGPILAVQAQKWIERLRETRERKLRIFYVLMGSRAARTSPEHVQALNLIDLLFRRKAERPIIEAWEAYREHLNKDTEKMTPFQLEAWGTRGNDHFNDLIYAMSVALGYHFTSHNFKEVFTARAPTALRILSNRKSAAGRQWFCRANDHSKWKSPRFQFRKMH